ncbi:hypothetical protein SDC9_88355 [bioreactor metagenome]|uniref:Uncharacterized protein n=1 Tax=bioreactor metagenome TaxID=1076179 RepID=A0A644ZLD0_9ZZZZ
MRGRLDCRHHAVVAGTGTFGPRRGLRHVESRHQSGRAQHHPAGIIGDFQWCRSTARRHTGIGQQHGATRCPELLHNVIELSADQPVQH